MEGQKHDGQKIEKPCKELTLEGLNLLPKAESDRTTKGCTRLRRFNQALGNAFKPF